MPPLHSNRPRTIALLSPFSLTLVVREFQWLVGEHAHGSREALESLKSSRRLWNFQWFFFIICTQTRFYLLHRIIRYFLKKKAIKFIRMHIFWSSTHNFAGYNTILLKLTFCTEASRKWFKSSCDCYDSSSVSTVFKMNLYGYMRWILMLFIIF